MQKFLTISIYILFAIRNNFNDFYYYFFILLFFIFYYYFYYFFVNLPITPMVFRTHEKSRESNLGVLNWPYFFRFFLLFFFFFYFFVYFLNSIITDLLLILTISNKYCMINPSTN